MRQPRFVCMPLSLSLLWVGGCDCWDNERPGSCEASGETSPEACELAPTEAHAVLLASCAACHGGGGNEEGGLGYVLDGARLVDEGKVIPGDPDASRLYQRLTDGSMPPPGSPAPSEDDISRVRDWIACGADPFVDGPERELIPHDEVYGWMADDIKTVPELEQPFVRYISIVHLYNAGLTEAELELTRQGVSKLVNSLSWGPRIVAPRPVDEDGLLLRIDLRDYRWESRFVGVPDKWELLTTRYPYAFQHDDSSLSGVIHATGARQPVLMGDWLVSVASEPPVYHEMLNIPQTQQEFLDLFNVVQVPREHGELTELDILRVSRAGFEGSGVSDHNRLIERYDAAYGYCWVSYDFAGSSGAQDIFEHPLDFDEDGGEAICSLPNHMQAYLVATAEGVRLDEGPVEIVSFPDRDNVIVNGRSCMNCHNKGILPKTDEILEHVLDGGFSPTEVLLVEAMHPPADELDALIAADQDRHLAALAAAGITDLRAVEPVDALYRSFEAPMTLRRVAAEVGLTEEELEGRLPRLPESLSDLYSLGGTTIDRATFLPIAQDLLCNLHSGEPALDVSTGRCAPPEGACGGANLPCEDGQRCAEGVLIDVEVLTVCVSG
jgi:hypothetical protein